MSVYVDNMQARFGRMIMCHMGADSVEELHAMADKIGIARRWFQGKNNKPHYDICLSKRDKAIRLGAIAVDMREMPGIVRACAAAAPTQAERSE